MIIDEVCQRLFQLPYDQNGEIAEQGEVVDEILTYCMNHPFLKMNPPKSTGREQFGEEFVSQLLKRYEKHSKENILTTVTMFTASSIVHHYKEFILPYYEIDEVILGGGGSYNDTLVEMIRYGLKDEKCTIFIQEDIGYSSEAKEAIAFAILANETYHRNSSNVPSATGAKEICSFRECNVPFNMKKMRRTYMKYMIGIDGGERRQKQLHLIKTEMNL